MDGVFNEGDKVKVKLVGLDPETGKFKLSRKALMPRPESSPEKRADKVNLKMPNQYFKCPRNFGGILYYSSYNMYTHERCYNSNCHCYFR
jgi:predicted RNA-binding protein with RPS1 domain